MSAVDRETPPLDGRSRHLRRLIVEALAGGRRGHLGSSMSLVEILRALYDHWLRVRPAEPLWEGRDRFILSKGHGCLAHYALLADLGFIPRAELQRFCHLETILGGHPERGKIPGVEASTGALGHGLSIGVGLALAARIKQADWRVAVVLGDGEINEGSVWEAAMAAGKHRLERLLAVVDYNKLQSYGPTREVQDLEPLAAKWESFGWGVREVDGHHMGELTAALAALPFTPGRPSVIIAHTVKGKGMPFAEHQADWHHKSKISDEMIAEMRAALGEEA